MKSPEPLLEALRPQQGINQIRPKDRGYDYRNDVFHIGLLETVATPYIRPGDEEKHDSDDHEKQIQHILISP